MNTETVKWEKIELRVEYEYEPAQKETFDSPGCDESLTPIEAYLPNGSDLFSRLNEKGIAEIGMLLREKLEGKAEDSETERALDVVMGRREWDGFLSHGRRVLG